MSDKWQDSKYLLKDQYRNADKLTALIANHCLYHIPDRQKAFSEIRRVLKSGGRFCATTIGRLHLEEMRAVVLSFDPSSEDIFSTQGNPFTLENGGSQLESWFANIHVTRYPDAFHVTEAAPLVDYIFSSSRLGLAEDRRAAFRRYLEAQIEADAGVFKIKKDSGIFLAQAP